MLISDYLKENQIELDLKSREKKKIIEEVGALLKDSPQVKDFSSFLQDVLDREGMSTTGIGHEVGIPHARSEAVSDFVIAFGRSKEGIEFSSLDGKPAKLFFIMGTPKEKNLSQYLQLLSQLTRLLKEDSFRSSLLKAQSPKEIISIFHKAEK